MITEEQQNIETIIPIQVSDFKDLMKFAFVSEAEFCSWFDIKTISELRKNQVNEAMCMLSEQGAENHRLKVDNHG